MNLRMLRVKQGDCLWIDYGDPANPSRVLIDGGPSGCTSLRAQIDKELTKHNKLMFELLVVTHIDLDHINGIIELLSDLPEGVSFGEIWFNAYQHLLPTDRLGGKPIRAQIEERASTGGDSSDRLGAKEGEDLAEILAAKFADVWNTSFPSPQTPLRQRKIVIPAEGPLPVVKLPGGAKITLLSPLQAQLDALAKKWRTILRDKGLKPGSGLEAGLSAAKDRLGKKDKWPPNIDALGSKRPRLDTSEHNGSSIAFVFEYDGRRILFGADAFAPTLAAGIKRLLSGATSERFELAAFKLSHHGSAANLTNELLDLLRCSRYLISTDGSSHSHPDHEALARIIVRGGKNPTLLFNARSKTTKDWGEGRRARDWPAFEAVYPEDNEVGLILPL